MDGNERGLETSRLIWSLQQTTAVLNSRKAAL